MAFYQGLDCKAFAHMTSDLFIEELWNKQRMINRIDDNQTISVAILLFEDVPSCDSRVNNNKFKDQ